MQCPADGTTLVMSERSGIEIDYCPQCRGVWLDRGELDKIIERSLTAPPPSTGQYGAPVPGAYEPPRYDQPGYQQPAGQQSGYDGGRYDEPRYDGRRHDEPRYDDRGRPHRRKRESWLSELFD